MNSRQKAKLWPYPRHKQFSKTLRQAAASWFEEKQYPTQPRRPYYLAQWSDWPANIILKEVADYIAACRADAQRRRVPFPLHKWLHHGMSSQAMIFNLIGPMITRHEYGALASVLKSKQVPGAADIAEALFEYEDRDVFNEDAGQPTSMDVVLVDTNGRPSIFIESKFDEQEFGGCSIFSDGDCSGKNPIGAEDSCFIHFIGRNYWLLMAKYNISQGLQHDRQCPFAAHYQFFREVILTLEKGGTFILLSDERSPVFQCDSGKYKQGLMPFLTSLLPESVQKSVISISTQELVAALEQRPCHHDWVFAFKKKYAMA
ncbi:MAG: hypothetical protein RBS95_08440 [Desulfobulbus sp.]|jgi:hypothetical protein|nr:hypothetical protein [Desulfobulbus sp.]